MMLNYGSYLFSTLSLNIYEDCKSLSVQDIVLVAWLLGSSKNTSNLMSCNSRVFQFFFILDDDKRVSLNFRLQLIKQKLHVVQL